MLPGATGGIQNRSSFRVELCGELHDLANLALIVLPRVESVVEMWRSLEHHAIASVHRATTLCSAAFSLLLLTSYISSSAACRISPVPAGGSRNVTHPRLSVTGN